MTSTPETPAAAPFSRIKIRTGALVFCGNDIALIRRDRHESITPELRATLAEVEWDEQPDGSHEIGVIEWIDYRKTAELPIFPPIGPALAALADPRAAIANAALAAVTDDNYTWM
ncbi:hypothetical protein [Streptomyces sp. NPDC001930]|uniref:hypothetical protein n=1 Tax=Streptomyces sp. NPDC001930 TaxID=3364625 RepID=UPI0036C2A012